MLVAEVTVFFERLVDDVLELRRQVGVEAQGRSGRAVQNGVVDHGRGRARERLPARGHFIEHRPEGEEVSTRVEFLSSCLLGRHISNSAHGYAWTRQQFISSRGL